MIDWRQGGWSGSINRWVDREVRGQLRANPIARSRRYPFTHRILRFLFSSGSFLRFVLVYLNLVIGIAVLEVLSSSFPSMLPTWNTTYTASAYRILHEVPGYLIAAQIGLLGVISIALALISLIGQRDEASVDVQVYYHESMFFGIVASSLALVLFTALQLLWPLQAALRFVGIGAANPSFRLTLLSFHLAWFCLNVIAVLHFVGITFHFVQRSARQNLRERYTANVLLPHDMRSRLRLALYRSAAQGVSSNSDSLRNTAPLIAFGATLTAPYEVELASNFGNSVCVTDVRVRLAQWALRRWCKRCAQASQASTDTGTLFRNSPSLWFTPNLDQPLRKSVNWCRRRGGVPLDWKERLALRFAFKFSRVKDAY